MPVTHCRGLQQSKYKRKWQNNEMVELSDPNFNLFNLWQPFKFDWSKLFCEWKKLHFNDLNLCSFRHLHHLFWTVWFLHDAGCISKTISWNTRKWHNSGIINALFDGLTYNIRLRTGHGKPGKSWNVIISFSRPGKSWNWGVGHGKTLKSN